MNRNEALRILGLDADASAEDIKAAYRETAQILHPDRFAGNKNLQEAYDVLMGKRVAGNSARAAGRAAASGSSRQGGLSEEREIEARLAGIAAARVQLAAQRDAFGDERRNGLGFLVVGAIVALVCGRRPTGLFLAVTGLATAAAIWGAVQVISSQRSISALDARLSELGEEQKKLKARLDELR